MSIRSILGGDILANDFLKRRGLNDSWLKKQLGSYSSSDVFLMTLDDNGTVNIILKEENK